MDSSIAGLSDSNRQSGAHLAMQASRKLNTYDSANSGCWRVSGSPKRSGAGLTGLAGVRFAGRYAFLGAKSNPRATAGAVAPKRRRRLSQTPESRSERRPARSHPASAHDAAEKAARNAERTEFARAVG